MAFDFRAEFKESQEKFVLGIELPTMATDMRTATEVLLQRIAVAAESAKNNPEKLKQLQEFAISIVDTYFANSQYGAGSEITNVSSEIMDKLKNIIGNNEEIRSKHQVLDDKLRETTAPTPKSSEIVLETNVQAHSEYQSLIGNEARREFVMDEFENGKFSDASHIDFFLEQYAKGELYIKDEDKVKFDQLITGIDGYAGLVTKYKEISEQIMASSLKYTSVSLGAEAMGADTATTKTADLGLSETLNEIKKRENKDAFDALIFEANKRAVAHKFNGGPTDHDANKQLYVEKQKLKWYQFKRKRQIEKAIRDNSDEGCYWSSRYVNGEGFRPYLKLRSKLEKNKSQDFNHHLKGLKKTIEMQSEYAGMRWMSTNIFKKLKLKSQLMFRRSPETKLQKVLENATISDLKTLSSDFKAMIENVPQGTTKLQRQNFEQQKKLLEDVCTKATQQQKILGETRDAQIAALGATSNSKTMEIADKFVQRLNDHVKKLQEQRDEQLSNDPRYKALIAKYGKIPENCKPEETITTDAVLLQICKDQGFNNIEEFLQSKGITGATLEALKEKLMPKQKIETEEKKPSNENTNDENVDKKHIILNNKVLDVEIESKTYESGKKIHVSSDHDRSQYGLSTTDKNGEPRAPTSDEIKQMVAQLRKDGIEQIDIQGFDTNPEVLKTFLTELKGDENNKPIEVTNKDEIEKKIEQLEKEKAEKAKQEAEEQAKREKEETGRQNTGSDGKKMSIEQVMINAVQNSKTTEEQTAKLEMINNIRNGKIPTEGAAYLEYIREIDKVFGENSKEALFLQRLAGAKSIEQDIKREGLEGDRQLLQDFENDKRAANVNIHANTDRILNNISQVTEIAKNMMSDNEGEREAAQKKLNDLPGYAQQGVENLMKLEKAFKEGSVNSEAAARLRGQILGQVIEGKTQSAQITKAITKIKSNANPKVIRQGNSNG